MEIISQWFFFLISPFRTLFILNFCHFFVCFSCNLKSVCVFALIYNKCGEYRFLCVHLYFFSKMVFLLFCCSKTVRCLCECVILWDLGTEFSTCGFSFESTPSTIQTCEKIVLPFSGGTFSNVVTSAYEWVKNHQLPLSGG